MRTVRFAELSYARPDDPPFKRWVIRTIESLSGRERLANLYEHWRSEIFGKSESVFTEMLNLIEVKLDAGGHWPPVDIPDTPIVMVANHPYGIGDGIAFLSLAEQLGRPFRVIINNDLLKVPEIRPYSLPISFEDTKEALALNLQTRKEAVRLLKEGVTIVIFPAGGVATAHKGFGRAEDLPWKMFTAKLIQAARASVIPVYFEGQNGRLFHLVSQFSLTLRTSMLIREFQRLYGKQIRAWIGQTIPWDTLARIDDRKVLLQSVHNAVFSLDPNPSRRIRPATFAERY
ncbi:lysophospholipid acyltransferase family protein [Oricola thermophila]|uniref:Lysophospholipid acyltransferase family protein n=1 Tax=Oricola thermophila TaxID=2742145 RepID=A0A6N1VMW1_9HYPH|nr:lysophospholipid acyltransferase family protein [Oricola thermophila]QKV20529.1 lysophospholipid acyltransferase family protein [Oricola thermophila]